MLATINQVLGGYGNKSIATEFPEFARNNYFLNSGTYNRDVATYKVIDNPTGTLTQEKEWQLFRHWLGAPGDPRKTQPDTTPGVLVDSVGKISTYPIDGPIANNPVFVGSMGVAYTEFYTTTLPANRAADLTITFSLRVPAGSTPPKVSVLRIVNFAAQPHPPNNFVQPTTQVGSLNLIYNRQVINFKTSSTSNRVVVIISDISPTLGNVPYMYSANIVIR